MIEELTTIADEMAALLPLFVNSSMSGLILPTEHSATFKALAIEAKSILDQELGLANDYSMNLLHAANSGAGGLFGGPSYASVEEASKIVRAVSGRLNANGLNAKATIGCKALCGSGAHRGAPRARQWNVGLCAACRALP